MRKGKHSSSPRLQSLLASVNRRNVNFFHNSEKSGKHIVPDSHSILKDPSCRSKDCVVVDCVVVDCLVFNFVVVDCGGVDFGVADCVVVDFRVVVCKVVDSSCFVLVIVGKVVVVVGNSIVDGGVLDSVG